MAATKKPIGIIILIIWQILVTAYCILRLITFVDVVSISGIEYGMSNIECLKSFFLIVCLVNSISFIGICKGLDWGRWVYIIALTMVVIFRVVQFIFFNSIVNSNEWIIVFLNVFITGYLLIDKKVKKYFYSKHS